MGIARKARLENMRRFNTDKVSWKNGAYFRPSLRYFNISGRISSILLFPKTMANNYSRLLFYLLVVKIHYMIYFSGIAEINDFFTQVFPKRYVFMSINLFV